MWKFLTCKTLLSVWFGMEPRGNLPHSPDSSWIAGWPWKGDKASREGPLFCLHNMHAYITCMKSYLNHLRCTKKTFKSFVSKWQVYQWLMLGGNWLDVRVAVPVRVIVRGAGFMSTFDRPVVGLCDRPSIRTAPPVVGSHHERIESWRLHASVELNGPGAQCQSWPVCLPACVQ